MTVRLWGLLSIALLLQPQAHGAYSDVYNKVNPLMDVHETACKAVAQAAILAYKAERRGVLRRKWMRGIARSIGHQAEKAIADAVAVDEAGAEQLTDALDMRDFMGEVVQRIYRPDEFSWPMRTGYLSGSSDYQETVCTWLHTECAARVAAVLTDPQFSEEAHRTRFALQRWRGSAIASIETVLEWWGTGYTSDEPTDAQWGDLALYSKWAEPLEKCEDTLEEHPFNNDPATPPRLLALPDSLIIPPPSAHSHQMDSEGSLPTEGG